MTAYVPKDTAASSFIDLGARRTPSVTVVNQIQCPLLPLSSRLHTTPRFRVIFLAFCTNGPPFTNLPRGGKIMKDARTSISVELDSLTLGALGFHTLSFRRRSRTPPWYTQRQACQIDDIDINVTMLVRLSLSIRRTR